MNKRILIDRFFHFICFTSTMLCLAFLFFFLFSLILNGYQALTNYEVKLPYDNGHISIGENLDTRSKLANYKKEFVGIYKKIDPNFTFDDVKYIVNYNALLDYHANSKVEKQTNKNWVTVSQKLKNYLTDQSEDRAVFVNKNLTEFINRLLDFGLIRKSINWGFFINPDSSDPQMAGIYQALIGSLLTVSLCILISIPVGIILAIFTNFYVKPKFLEILLKTKIANLASIPSIIYGIIGLYLFINILDIPRSSSLAGALTLSMLAIPIIFVLTDKTINSLDQNTINAAFALGASKMQVILKHVIPMSINSIITGTVIATSRVIGETAPLLMIGMIAFITAPPHTITDPATTMPVQIYTWTNNPDPEFSQKASLAILLLLLIIAIFNIISGLFQKKVQK